MKLKISSLLFALWTLAILARGGSYLWAILPLFLSKLAYLAAWRIVGMGILPQGVACLKLAACRVIQLRAS